MIALPEQAATLDYHAEVAITVTLRFSMQHEIGLPYPPSHSDIDILLKNEARGDAIELTRNLFHFSKQHQLPVTGIEFERVEGIDVQRIAIK